MVINMGMDFNTMSVEDRITRAKIQMQKKQPFFAYLLMHLNIKKVDDSWFEALKKQLPELADLVGRPFTMGVDNYGNMYYSEKWVKSLTERELEGVMCHEVMHCALEHMDRTGVRNHQIANIAQDMVVNDIVMSCKEDSRYSSDRKMFDLPKEGIIPDEKHTCRLGKPPKYICVVKDVNKKPYEEVYDEIYPKIPKIKISISGMGQGDGKGQGQSGQGGNQGKQGKGKSKPGAGGGFDIHIRRPPKGKGKGKDGKKGKGKKGKGGCGNDWKTIIAEAATYAKQRGQLPAGMERRIDGLLESKINWQTLLWKFLTREIPYDYTYSRPHKKSISAGFYMPSVMRENIEIMVAVDTSGSIGDDELKDFLSEIVAMARSFRNVRMTMLVCDADIQNVHTVENGNIERIMSLEMKGGGGTDHRPVFKWIRENKPMTRVLMCLTDGYTAFPAKIPNFSVIWVLSKNSVPETDIPFGHTVKIE